MHKIVLEVQDTVLPLFLSFIESIQPAEITVISDTEIVLSSKQELLKTAFTAIKDCNVFGSVENPLAWQKEIRNEW